MLCLFCPPSGKLNQLGGVFVNGKPLPNSVRQRIIEMAELGIRPCDISRQMKVSHGCISKLLSKYNDTGSFEPGRAKRKTSRDVSSEVKNKIEEYRRATPGIFSWEIKEKLVADGYCTKESLPPLTVISRLLRRARSTDSECDTPSVGGVNMGMDSSKENALQKGFTAFSIDNILKAEDKWERRAGKTEEEKMDTSGLTPTKVIDLGEQLTLKVRIIRNFNILYSQHFVKVSFTSFQHVFFFLSRLENNTVHELFIVFQLSTRRPIHHCTQS